MLDVAFGDEGASALLGIEDAANFHLSIGTSHGIGIDGEVDGYAADSGKLVSDGYGSRGDGSLDLVDQLPVDGNAAVLVEAESELGASVFC
jgi:hypothetical protein